MFVFKSQLYEATLKKSSVLSPVCTVFRLLSCNIGEGELKRDRDVNNVECVEGKQI